MRPTNRRQRWKSDASGGRARNTGSWLGRGALLCGVLTLLAACGEEAVGPPDGGSGHGATPLQVQEDIQTLIGGGLAGWWRASHGPEPGAALSTAADAHTSSWRNWGMLDAGAEPRRPLVTDPENRFQFIDEPWVELYRTLVAARDGLLAIAAGAEIGEGGETTDRAVAMARFLQGMALGQLAMLFDAAYIVDETTDIETVALSPYPDVLEAALEKLDEAVATAEAGDFTIPAHWIGFAEPMGAGRLAALARSYRARYRMGVARSPAERAAVDWAAVLADVEQGLQRDWEAYYDGDWENNWAWAMDKLFAGVEPNWARLDYRTIGPADASGAWETWINAPPSQRTPFHIDTDDRRITGGDPTADGLYVRYEQELLFRPERGVDHFSWYWDGRWFHLFEARGVGHTTDFPVKELDLIRAEALLRLGAADEAMAIVNASRQNGGLPGFATAESVAPGGARCVPQRPDGSCGDLWEALKYEKRIELFHYGPFTEFLDDRGWGDLTAGTFVQLPAPAMSLAEILERLYGEGASASASLAGDASADGLRAKVEAYGAFDRAQNANPGDVGAG